MIEDGGTSQHGEMMVLDALCGVEPPEMEPTIAKKDTTKEASYAIMTLRVSDDHVKKAMV
jgi:hypothetical protein